MESVENEYRIVGPPGTGKTRAVIDQAAMRLSAYKDRTGQSSSIGCTDVLMASLTKAAAAEIRGRGLEINPDQIGTLHSHCYRALGGPKMCVSGDAIKQWNEECGSMQYMLSGDSGTVDDPLGGSIGRYGGDEMLAMCGVYRSRCESRKTWRPDVTQFVDRYETWKRINGFMDFHDLIDRCLADDVPPPNHPSVILLDEAQDCVRQEMNLVRQWAKYVSKLIVVGDSDQNLYFFRGADPKCFYETKIPDGHTKVLEQSYRVPRAVHEAAMKIIRLVDDRVPIVYHPRDEDGVLESSPHSLRSDPGPVIDEIETILSTTDETVMLLFSCAYMASSAAEMLRRRGILYWNPYAPGRSRFNPFHPQHGTSTLDKVRSFLRPSREVFGDDARLWTYRELQDWSSLCNGEGWLLRGARKDIESAAKMFGQDAVSIDFLRRVVDPDFDLSELAHVNLSWLLKHRSSQSAVLMETIGMSAERIGESKTVNADPRVIVGTVHSVKGGEAHHVYVCPDLSASGFDLFNSSEGRDATLRMLYVAVTRARKRLVLTAPGGRMAFDWSEAGL